MYIYYERDFSNLEIMFLHLKLYTRFVLPRLISAIQSFQNVPSELNKFEALMNNHVYRIRQFQCILRNYESNKMYI